MMVKWWIGLAAGLLAVAPAQAQRWAEFPREGGGESMTFLAIDRIAVRGPAVDVPMLHVDRGIYYENILTIDCAAGSFSSTAATGKLRRTGADNSGVLADAGRLTGWPMQSAIAARVCPASSPKGFSDWPQSSGDPKPAAWRAIDAAIARYPAEIDEALRRVGPSLVLNIAGNSIAVTAAAYSACEVQLTLAGGKRARLRLPADAALRPTPRLDFIGGANLRGFPPEGFRALTHKLDEQDCFEAR